jgi:hypothetical protein
MTLLNYTDPVPTPAPVTIGTTIQTYQDPTGEWWVAKNGVRSGIWYKARDVLHCRYSRSAAYTFATTGTLFPWDWMVRDPYTLWRSGGTFVLPISGIWRADYQLVVAFTATTASGQYVSTQNNGPNWPHRTNTQTLITGNQYHCRSDSWQGVAGDTIGLNANTNVALAIPAAGLTTSDNYFDLSYVGTG